MINSEIEIEKLEVWNGPSRPPYYVNRLVIYRQLRNAHILLMTDQQLQTHYHMNKFIHIIYYNYAY